MTNPVPGYALTTPYGARGPYWGCDPDAYGHGKHTGADYAAPAGAKVVAARPGTVVYCNYGAAFGNHQMAINCGDGTRDFYAHMTTRTVNNGARVEAGQTIGKVGAEGNVSGPHLHFERHGTTAGGWSCGVVRDPAPSINYAASGGSGAGAGEDDDMPSYAHGRHDKNVKLTDGEWLPIDWEDSNPDVFDGIGIKVGGAKFTATLSADVTDRDGARVETSWVEIEDGETVETYATAAHGETNYVVETRNGLCQDGRRLRARIRVRNGNATLNRADINILFWK